MPPSPGETGKYESYWLVGADMGQSWWMGAAMLVWLEVETGERSSLSGVESPSKGVGGVPSPVPPLRGTISTRGAL